MKLSVNRIVLFIIFLYPLQDLPIPIVSFFYTKPLSFLLLSLIAILLFFYKRRFLIDKGFTFLLFFLLFISILDNFIVVLICARAIDITDFLRSLLEVLLLLATYNLLYSYFLRADKYQLIDYIKILSYSFSLIVLPICLIEIYVKPIWSLIYPLIHSGSAYSVENFRIFVTYTEPSWFTSSLLLTIFPLVYSMILTKKYILNKYYVWFVFISANFCIINSTSRIGIVTAIVVLLVGLILYQKDKIMEFFQKKSLSLSNFIYMLVIITAIFFIFSNGGSRKEIYTLTNLQTNYSNITRLGTAITSFNVFKNYPLGVGFHNFHLFFREKFVPSWSLISPEIQDFLSKKRKANPKNMYARLLVETGIFGFVSFFLYIFRSFKKAYKLNDERFIKYYVALSFISLLLIYLNTDSLVLLEPLLIISFINVAARRRMKL